MRGLMQWKVSAVGGLIRWVSGAVGGLMQWKVATMRVDEASGLGWCTPDLDSKI